MYCQACGAFNPDEPEFCFRCQQKLLVVSGGFGVEELEGEEESEEGFSLDEHLLERISVLEEAVKRTAETVRHLVAAHSQQERSILVSQTGISALRELLQDKRLVAEEEWSDLWRAKMDNQLLAVEKRERFTDLKERIAALYKGDRRQLFGKLLADAEAALAALDVERALPPLEAAFKLDRDNYELAFFLGETYFNDGQGELALSFMRRVLEVRPDHHEGLVFSGVILHERGDQVRAEKHLKRAVALYTDSFLPHFSLGAVYAAHGRLSRAVVLLERAVEIDPVPQALFLLGSCLYEMGRLSGSIRVLQQLVRQDPANEEAHHLMGLAYLDRGWNRKALESFRLAQRLNPKRLRYQDLVRYLSSTAGSPLPAVPGEARTWLMRAEDHLRRDQAEPAFSCFRKALEASPESPTVLLSYALACLRHDRSREAERTARRLLELEPEEMLRVTAYAALMEALRGDGRWREGNREGERLLAEGRTDFARTIAYYEMAHNLAEMEEDLDRALEFALRSLELSPQELRQFPLAAVGWVHYKREEFPQAADYLGRAAELERTASTLTHLGMALLAAGEESRAREVLAEARQADAPGGSLEQRMMECLQDSSRLHARVHAKAGPAEG